MSEEKARLYFQQIITAVKHLHSKNIIHRDLKPENILIDKKNNCIKITDFGLSALLNRKDQILTDIAGTTDYLAPEVIKQTGYLGQSADIWSCGVILYNCVTGNKPFIGSNSVMLNNILTGKAEYPYNRFSPSLFNLFKRIFVPNPKTRITIEEIIKDEWFSVGYDEILQNEKNFLEKNQIESPNLHTKKDGMTMIKTVYLNQKDFSFDLNEVELISCLELGLILYGRAIGSLFSSNSKGNFNDTKNYKFICKKGNDALCSILKKYFEDIDAIIDFTKVDKDKVIINLNYKDDLVCALLQIFKLNKFEKCMYIISYYAGSITEYYKLFSDFLSKCKDSIEKF